MKRKNVRFHRRRRTSNYAFHYDDAAFRVGDRVMLVIQRHNMERKQIYGRIVAKV